MLKYYASIKKRNILMDTLYSYKTIFTISNQSSLDDFWSFVIFRLNIEKSQYTYDRFARLYNMLCACDTLLSNKTSITITIEESHDNYYISVSSEIPKFITMFTQRLSQFNFPYSVDESYLRYFISKKNKQEQDVQKHRLTQKKYTYDFLNYDDLDEMTNILEKMHTKNYDLIYPQLELSEINDYRTTFSYYCSYLQYYPQLSTVNNIVAELSVLLSLYSQNCLDVGNDFRVLLQSFLNNLLHWQENLFIKGSEKIDFMDVSLKADLEQIKIVLELYDEIDEDKEPSSVDDIFEF